MHTELSYYQKNKDRFGNVDTYFEKLYCNLYNLYKNNIKEFYEMIKTESTTQTQIIEIINSVINYYVTQEKYEDCHQLLLMRQDVSNNIKQIFE